ncbi:NAD-dependent epimerase/dehydratase family protein [Myxococcota bacterium]|nr:NAD-dependent epimerase/dehydratase family protein [Myxococcota bacterium]
MEASDAQILVTGGAGFIGAHVVARLLSEGARVRVLDDLSTGSLSRLPAHEPRLDFVRASVVDLDRVRDAVRGCAWVFHLAAVASVPASVVEPTVTHAVNATGTLNVFVAALEAGVRRVVYASSSAVYGPRPDLPAREDGRIDPASPYATSKAAGEWYARNLAATRGLDAVGLRYFNVYGPLQDPASPYAAAIPLFVRAIARGEPVTVFGDGLQTRDFVHVKDVVEANLAASRAPASMGQVFNVGTGRAVTVLDLLAAIGRATGRAVEVAHQAPRVGDVRHSVASVDSCRDRLGFLARVGLVEGLTETCAWYLREGSK